MSAGGNTNLPAVVLLPPHSDSLESRNPMSQNATTIDAQAQRGLLLVLFSDVFMSALDVAIVAPALPLLRGAFAIDNSQASPFILLYSLCSLASRTRPRLAAGAAARLRPPCGRLGPARPAPDEHAELFCVNRRAWPGRGQRSGRRAALHRPERGRSRRARCGAGTGQHWHQHGQSARRRNPGAIADSRGGEAQGYAAA
jgi:hypothetical protein